MIALEWDVSGITMNKIVTGDITIKPLMMKLSLRLENVDFVVQRIRIVEHSNGTSNIVAGGRRTFVNVNWNLP